ncbi:hypothetical protein D3C85_552760 [compost metagenome]
MVAKIVGVSLDYGSVRFSSKEEATQDSVHTNGSVTVQNMGKPGRPAYYAVTHMLEVELEAVDGTHKNFFNWTSYVKNEDVDAPYWEVEASAARALAVQLRQIADLVEMEVRDADERKANAKAG